jgi:DNA-binding transcriptional LysR family regulator
MQVESLKVFCDVIRYRSFSQAAAANEVTQSAVSQIVSQIEKRMGVQLIDRSTRPLQLTELGKSYYEGCRGLVEQYLELEASIRDGRSELESTVQVAAIYSVGLGDMGQYVERFQKVQPHARVHLEYLHPDRVYERVLDGTADFGLVSFPRKARDLICLPWRDEEMVLACSPGHPLAGCRTVRPGQLAGERYVGFDKHLGIRKEVDRFLREHEVEVQVSMEFDNIENIKKAVEIAAGVALLPEPTIRHEVEAGTLVAVPLSGCRLVRPLGIIQNRHHKLSATALRFRDLLRHANGGMSSRENGHANGEAARSGNGRTRHAGKSTTNGRTDRSRPNRTQ